ncbi:MAG: hypothetical protein ABJC79_02415, partial [Acidimicrobiia bacterium]
MNLRTKVSAVVLATATTAAVAFPALSGASPIDDKQRQAAELQRQIDANDNQLVALSEKLNGATLHLKEAQAGIDEAQRRTDAAEGERRRVRSILSRRAAQMYQGAGASSPLADLDVKSLGEVATRSRYASAAADDDDVLIARLQRAKEALAERKAELERQRGAAQAEKDAADAARAKIDSANRQARALEQQVKGEIATIIQQQATARAAAQQRVAQAGPPRSSGSHAPIPTNFPDVPAPNAGAAAAV